nr:phage head closure protein [Fredinandcohnia onubensis]
MTFDYELTLIRVSYIENDIGDHIPTENKSVILCDVQSVTRSEHYSAATHGLKPEIVFVVNKFDYQGQKEIEFEGVRYKVIRDYTSKQAKGIADFETIELICKGMSNHANA